MTDAGISGRLHDGKSAAIQAVTVTLAPTGIVIDANGAERSIPYADVRLIDADAREIRLGLATEPEFRLVLPASARAAVHEHAPHILSVSGARRRMLALIGGLVAASALIAAVLFIGAPMVAEPLAKRTPPELEAAMGENVTAQIVTALRPCRGDAEAEAQEALAPLMSRIANAIDTPFALTVSFVKADAPNALALPGGNIVITDGLLQTLEAPDELAAVIAHEAGHVESRDGLVALYRHAGLGIALEAVTGGSGLAQQMVLVAGQLTDLRHTRAQEMRADETAMRILDDLAIDPAALGRALQRLSDEAEDERPRRRAPEWASSHPDVAARIKAAKARAKPQLQPLDPAAWATVRAACAADADQ